MTYTLALTNTGEALLTGLTVSDTLPDGLVYLPGSATAGGFDPRTRRFVWQVSSLASNTQQAGFQARVSGNVRDDLIVNQAEVLGEGLAQPVQARTTVAVARQAVITPGGGVLETPNSRVRVEFPPGAVDGEVHARYVARPEHVTTTRFYVFELGAWGEDGRSVSRFSRPVTLKVRYSEEDIGNLDPAGLRIVWFDEARGQWVPLPSQVDTAQRTITAQTDHFSLFGAEGTSTDMADHFTPEFIPSVMGAQVSQFTGDATYEVRLYVPPGPGGLTPDLTLRYSSGGVNDNWLAAALGGSSRHPNSQPSQVGQGWSLGYPGFIIREIPDPANDLGNAGHDSGYSGHKYVLSLNGISGRLVKIPFSSPPTYYPENSPDWRLTWSDGPEKGTWEAHGPDGTRYTFAQTMDMNNWTTPGSCGDGYTVHKLAQRWYLTEIRDTSGNQIRYIYSAPESDDYANFGGCLAKYTRRVTLLYIEYGLNESKGLTNPRVQIEFVLQNRTDWNSAGDWDEDKQAHYSKKMVDKVVIRAWDQPSGGLQVVRTYDFGYEPQQEWDSTPDWLTLREVHLLEKGNTPSQELPKITFTYDKRWTDDSGSGHYNRKLLTEIKNGYGGRVVFTYEHFDMQDWCYEEDPCQPVERYRVHRLEFYDGLGEAVQRYDYVYSGAMGDDDDNEFLGHAQATETVYKDVWVTSIVRTITDFHQRDDGKNDPRMGRPKQVKVEEKQGANWVELRKQVNTWGWSKVKDGMDVRQAVLVETNSHHNNGLTRQRTGYLSDTYGNTRAELSYGRYDGSTVAVNNPGFVNMDWWMVEQGVDASTGDDEGQLVMKGGTSGYVWQDVSVTSGKSYQVTVWVRATGGTTPAKFKLVLHNGSGGNYVESPWVTPDTSRWQLVQLTYTANSTSNMRIHLNYQAGDGKIYVDNVTAGEVDTSGDERTTHWQYYPNESAWIVSRVAQETVYDGIKVEDDDSGKVAQTRYHYDATTGYPLSGTTSKVWNASPDYGLLTQVDAWDGSTYHATGFRYDAYGNQQEVIDPRNSAWKTTTYYDSAFHAFPVCVKNALDHKTQTQYYGVPGSGDSACLSGDGSSASGSGAYFGKAEAVTDLNDVSTTYKYDVFGRMTEKYRPYDTSEPTVRVEYTDYCTAGPCTVAPPVKVRVDYREKHNDTNAFRPILYFYDGLGREIQTKAESVNGNEMIVTNTSYDERGLVKYEYVPYKIYDPGSFWNYVTPDTTKPKTSYTYDGLERVTQVTYPDGTATTTTYYVARNDADPDFAGGRLAMDVTDANGHTVRKSFDAYGNLQTVTEYLSGVEHRTRYAYDTLGNLTTVTDTLGNVTTVTYDRLGRKTQMDDPDMGGWVYAYDAAGNLTRQTDARNRTVCFYYDELNRLKGKTYRTDLNCPSDPGYGGYAVAYTYDSTAGGNKGVGRRTGMDDDSGSTSWTYDQRGRVTQETQSITAAGSFTTTYTPGLTSRTGYYADDQIRTITYPDSEVITYTYTAQGLPDSLQGTLAGQFTNYSYVSASTYNAWGQPTQMLLGNSLTTQYAYHPLNSRLRRIQTGNLFDLHYAYDLVGNVGAIYDASRGETLRFSYDPLDRLTTFEQAPSPLKPIAIHAKGSNAEGWPIMQLRVNGVVVQEWTVDTTDWLDYTTQAPLTGDDQVDVVFTNDYCVPTGCEHGDRNLWVDYLVVDGQTVDVVTGTVEVDYDRGWGETAFDGQDVIDGQQDMYWAGALRTQVITGSGWTTEEGYGYNQIGNLTSKGGVSYTYPPSGPTSVRPHAVSSTSDGKSFGYDANGNLTGREEATLTYDAENRLETVTEGSRVTTFVYDGDGRRVKKVTPWGTTYYVGEHYEKYVPAAGVSVLAGDIDLDCQVQVDDIQTIAGRWGAAWSLQYDVDQDGSDIDAGDIQTTAANWLANVPSPCTSAVVKYYRLGGRLVALRQNGQLRYIHTDHLGSLSLPTEQNFTGQQLDLTVGPEAEECP